MTAMQTVEATKNGINRKRGGVRLYLDNPSDSPALNC